MENIVVTTVFHLPVEEVFDAITRMEERMPCLRGRICELRRNADAETMQVKLDITGRVRCFEAKVVKYERNRCIEWRSTRGLYIAGEMIFETLPSGWTHLIFILHYHIEGVAEYVLARSHCAYHRVDAMVECVRRHLEASSKMEMGMGREREMAVS